MSALDDAPQVHADDRATWRAWLEANHASARGAWLVTWRAGRGHPALAYEDAIEEALCFGWVDSTGGRFDEDRGRLYFAPRKARSAWAATNKARVERLIAAGLMRPAGLAAIELAKANGSWTVLDPVERLEVPADLAAALEAHAAGRRAVRRLPSVGAQADALVGPAGTPARDPGRADRRGRRCCRARRTREGLTRPRGGDRRR